MGGQDDRAARLAAQLRENLKRRKAQARATGAGTGDRAEADAVISVPGKRSSSD